MLVDFVGDYDYVVFDAEGTYGEKLGSGEDFAQGIVAWERSVGFGGIGGTIAYGEFMICDVVSKRDRHRRCI